MIRRPPRSTQSRSSAASDVYKRQSVDSASEATTSNENVMSKSLENVDGVKSRWAKVLKDAGVETVADYLGHRGEGVLGFGEAGRKSVDEALRDVGISVPED